MRGLCESGRKLKKKASDRKSLPVCEFRLFGIIPVTDRSHVTTNPAENLASFGTLTHRYNIREAELKSSSIFASLYIAY